MEIETQQTNKEELKKKKEDTTGPLFGSIIIILIVIAGGIYFFSNIRISNDPVETRNEHEEATIISDIENVLESENIDNLDVELIEIETEIEAQIQIESEEFSN